MTKTQNPFIAAEWIRRAVNQDYIEDNLVEYDWILAQDEALAARILELGKQRGSAFALYRQGADAIQKGNQQTAPIFSTERVGGDNVLKTVNEQLAQLAASKGCVYLDLWEALADGEGNLKEMIAAPDGVHLSAGNGYGAWVTYLRNHAKYSASNPWIMGSAYSAE